MSRRLAIALVVVSVALLAGGAFLAWALAATEPGERE